MAFTITTAFDNDDVKDDPTYVKWFATEWQFKDGNWYGSGIPMHKCSKEELNRFYEPRKDQSSKVKKLQDANAFMCLDWSKVELYGNKDQDEFKYLDVNFLPCNVKETALIDG